MAAFTHRISVIDSHTGGEPTRIVISGSPDLGRGPLSERAKIFRELHDGFRSCIINEPRGSDVHVGALLCEPTDPTCSTGVIFFNNIGTIGMCGHGTIGLMTTLAHLGRIGAGTHHIETTVGIVSATLQADGRVTVRNVPSYRYRAKQPLDVPGYGRITGDIAWGGNWFFLVSDHRETIALKNVEQLSAVTWSIRQSLEAAGITGASDGLIDHIELFGPPGNPQNDSRNFVLCPGRAYDRSPCGTGTSAKLACLYADGKLKPGEIWRQEGILGSVFEGLFELADEPGAIVPSVTGMAYIMAEATLVVQEGDPFGEGIRQG